VAWEVAVGAVVDWVDFVDGVDRGPSRAGAAAPGALRPRV